MAGKKKGRNHYTTEQFIKAIPGTGGIITTIAKKVGCDWYTAKKFITQYATVQTAYQAERETVKDHVENALIIEAKEGESWAVKYYLSTQAKDRGYAERQEIDLTSDGESLGKALEGLLSKSYGNSKS